MLCEATSFSSLAKDYESLEINNNTVNLMQFEDLANRIQSAATLEIVKSLLDCLENRLTLSRPGTSSSLHDIDYLLKRLPRQRQKVSRYPVRVVLSAYMIVGHPDAVFNQQGERELLLAEAAAVFVREFEMLINMVVVVDNSEDITHLLEAFDAAWCSYLYRFVVWKIKDARSLEDDLVKISCKMELSMMQTCKLSADGENHHLTHDMNAVQVQVIEDHKLLREKVLNLTGNAGVQRMERALSNTRSQYFVAKKNESLRCENNVSSQAECPNSSEVLFAENEVIVNDIVHERLHAFTDKLGVSSEGSNDIKAKIKETMENAYWDSVTESLKNDQHDCGRIVELVKEVRDELCQMASKWEQSIFDAIDIDILAQVLKSGSRDLGYLGQILEFALNTLRKLSAEASEDELIQTHKKLMSELGEISQTGEKFAIATVKGLRFVLEQTQALKTEISKARIRILEPLIRGPDGYEYLRKAFGDHYGSPINAANSLPVTVSWFISVRSTLEQAWNEYTDSLSGLSASAKHGGVPQIKLRTGGKIYAASDHGPPVVSDSNHQPECTGNRVDKLVRFGLLKLICRTEGMTEETIPETLKLNLLRLRDVQQQIQIIIVTAISILVLRQTLVSEKLAKSASDMEKAVHSSAQTLTELLDRGKDVGIADIVETISQSFDDDNGQLQSRKECMGNMLEKSLISGDPVFKMVSGAVELAARGILFGGSGVQGKGLAEAALRRVGAANLSEKPIKAVEVAIVVETVSVNVHEPWHLDIMKTI